MIPIFCCKIISTSRKTLCFLFLHVAWQYRCKTVVDSVSHGIQEMSEILIGQDLGESEKQKAHTLILWKSTWLKLEQGSLLWRCMHKSSFSKTRLSGVRSVSPPSEYFNSKNVSSSTSYSDSYFVFFSCSEKKRFPVRVLLLRFWSDERPTSRFTSTAFSFPPIVWNDIGMPE